MNLHRLVFRSSTPDWIYLFFLPALLLLSPRTVGVPGGAAPLLITISITHTHTLVDASLAQVLFVMY